MLRRNWTFPEFELVRESKKGNGHDKPAQKVLRGRNSPDIAAAPAREAAGFRRYIVHWEIRQSITEADVEIILQRAEAILAGRDAKLAAAREARQARRKAS